MSEKPNRKTLTFSPGEIIAHEQEPGGDLMIIQSGVAEVFRKRGDEEIMLATLNAGEMIGVMTVMDSGPRTATVRAKTDVQTVLVDRDQVQRLMDGLPKWASAMLSDLTLRVKQADELYQRAYLRERYPELAQVPHGRFLRIAVKLSETFFETAKRLAGEGSPGQTINVSQVLTKMATDNGWREDDLRTVTQIFDQCELSPWTNADHRCGLNAGERFEHFSGFMARMMENSMLETAVGVLTAGNRKTLQRVAKAVEGEARNRVGQVEVTLKEIDDHLMKAGESRLDPHVLRQAAFLLMLEEVKLNGHPAARFHPQKLLLDVRCIDAVVALDRLHAPEERLEVKRTLVY